MSNNTKQKTLLNNGMTFLGEFIPSDWKRKYKFNFDKDPKQLVKVLHKWEIESNSNGTLKVEGKRKLNKSRPLFQKIVNSYVMVNGTMKILTISGDVWQVELNPNQRESKYLTVGNYN